MKKISGLLLFAMLSCEPSRGADSAVVLSIGQFYDMVLACHPIARQSTLIPQMARQQIVIARGGFDPYFFSNLDQKYFLDKEYFLLSESGIRIPAWWGIETKAEYHLFRGNFLNPQNNVPATGQALLGLSIPLAQGLFTDERRTTLRQAKIFEESSNFERINMLNDLLFNAAKDYWNWTLQYNQYRLLQTALIFATQQFEATKQSYQLGDVPAVDTLEAFIQVQNLQFNLNEALMHYRNARFTLSNYLWSEQLMPLELSENVIPPSLDESRFDVIIDYDSISQIIDAIAQTHPHIRQLQYAVKNLEVERRLKIEYLKPRINLQYNLLSNGRLNFNNELSWSQAINTNYKWGFNIAFPLFWGKSRGEYKLMNLKIQEARFKLQLKNLEIVNKIQSYFNELIILKDQVELYNSAVNNYRVLLEAEIIRFNTGESSMFLVNARQLKLLEFQAKLLEVRAKYFQSLAALAWASGNLYNVATSQ